MSSNNIIEQDLGILRRKFWGRFTEHGKKFNLRPLEASRAFEGGERLIDSMMREGKKNGTLNSLLVNMTGEKLKKKFGIALALLNDDQKKGAVFMADTILTKLREAHLSRRGELMLGLLGRSGMAACQP